MMPPSDRPLETSRLRLRRFRPSDLAPLHDIQRRPVVSRFLYWEPRDRQAVAAELARRMAEWRFAEDDDRLSFAVERKGDGALLGDVQLWLRSQEHRGGEIGFVFHPDHHRQGYGREAAVRILALGFETFGLHRIIGRCDARNTASAGLMAALGMRLEAHFREGEWFKGEWSDDLTFALLAREWPGSPPPPAPPLPRSA